MKDIHAVMAELSRHYKGRFSTTESSRKDADILATNPDGKQFGIKVKPEDNGWSLKWKPLS